MSKEITKDLDGKRSFEERVFARFDAIDETLSGLDSRVQNLDSRVQVLESKAYDTKPIWEKALKEIMEARAEQRETKLELKDFKRETTKRLDQIQAVQLQNRADIRELEDRVEKLESPSA
jgi:chromosome segregation ATPase